jgi:hypothetical protein
MTVVKDLIDEQSELATAKSPWDRYHRNVAAWVLPQTEQFDTLLNTGSGSGAVMAVTATNASDRSKHIYDMTSLWAIDRLTAGLISLKTPESDYWHDLNIDNDFGYQPSFDEATALERVRDYLFRVRGNPKSGFWSAHKAAVKSMSGFGDGWLYIKEQNGSRIPFTYEFMQIPELFPAVDSQGRPNRMYRVFNWTAAQIYAEFADKAGDKVREMANDPKRRHQRIRIMHGVRPRSDEKRNVLGLRGAQFASYYLLPDDNHLIGEGGYWEFPFTRYAWSNHGQRAFCEGPVALCIAEIQTLQEMAKNELIASQMLTRPPLATAGKNFTRLNFNPGATNPGLINGAGQQLFAPLNAGVRPDFAKEIIESRRNQVREMLYLNLWQILVADQGSDQETATRSMLRAQEKGEMLGPVGISLNEGLSANVDREINILTRKGAFRGDSPLAMPESLDGAEVSPEFTSPLDRLRRMGQVNGVRQLLEFMPALVQVQPEAAARIDSDEIMELVQDVAGAPARVLKPRKVAEEAKKVVDQQAQAATAIAGAQGTGDALRAVGEGAAAAATGAETVAQSPALRRIMQSIGNAGRAA